MSSKYAKATLGGKFLLASSAVRWVFTEGVYPHSETFDLTPEDAKSLFENEGDYVDLVIDDGENPKLTVKRLWPVSIVPGDNPNIARVLVKDRRMWLPYFTFLGRFNMRRNVGAKRVGTNTTEQLNPVVPKVWYWPWSLKKEPDVKWLASDIVKEFLEQLEEWEKGEGMGPQGWKLPYLLKQLDSKLETENLNLDDSGENALARLLSIYPNAGVFVDAEAKYSFFDKTDGGERSAVTKLGPVIVGSGQLKVVDNKFVRPYRVDVFFNMEVEVRHDVIGDQSTTDEDTRYMSNVLPVPDFELISASGEKYAQNSWIAVNGALRSQTWDNSPAFGGGPVTGSMIEKAALPYLDLWGALMLTGVRQPDANWAARVAAIQGHWRKSFQLSPKWMSRTLSIKARRCAIIDPTTGTWAPSEAFCNHSFIGTVRSFFKNVQEGKGMQFVVNVPGYPAGGQVPGKTSPNGALKFTNVSKAAPVIVQVIDGDQGIIRLNFQADPNHMYEAALPGRVVREDNNLFPPTANWKDPSQEAIGFDVVTNKTLVPKLERDWKACVILTHVPAAPNNKNQLYKITIYPNDIKDRLNCDKAQLDGKNCQGPAFQIRVGAGMDGAKALVRWLDDRAEDIEAIFGATDKTPDLRGLVVNHDTGGPPEQPVINLTEIALSMAAQVYSRYVDHYEGSGSGYMNPEVTLDGWIGYVEHMLSPRGEPTTTIKMKDEVQEISLLSLMDSSTRAVLLKLPHVDRQ